MNPGFRGPEEVALVLRAFDLQPLRLQMEQGIDDKTAEAFEDLFVFLIEEQAVPAG